jgi:hypothetical protein
MPDHDSPVGRVELALVHEQPGEDHRAGDRDHQADDHPLERGPAEGHPNPGAQRHREQDAERPAEERSRISHPSHSMITA